jgi:Mn2+/Fe2+ NRAMP family transporter
VAAASVVSLPGMPLIPLIYFSQVVNAVLLPLHVVALQLLSRDAAIMGEARSSGVSQAAGWVSITLIVACVGALAWSWLGAQP